MSAWATRRKIMYGGGFLFLVLLFIAIPTFLILYRQPTCSDGKKNGTEEGIDCGGVCSRLCTQQALLPVVRWARYFNVKGNVYSLVAYVENPNVTARSTKADYIFRVYSRENKLLDTRVGSTILPVRRATAIFEPNLIFNDVKPARVTFEFASTIPWEKTNVSEREVRFENIQLTGQDTVPRLDVTVVNPEVDPIGRTELVAIVYDSNENAVAASRTYIDSLSGGQKILKTFTWPKPIDAGEGVCALPVDVILAIDRSGSMSDDGKNPPQPLTDVKNAAVNFIDFLKTADQSAVLSFANSAVFGTSSTLSNSYQNLKQSIADISILSGGAQNTNIADAIAKASEEFGSSRHNQSSGKVLILLTDGAPTLPVDPEKKDKNYPTAAALSVASTTRASGVDIFTIGLGTKVNSEFMKALAGDSKHYFSAPTSKDLKSIYSGIATAMCKKEVTSIEIIPKIQ